jgi:hypothetical protein
MAFMLYTNEKTTDGMKYLSTHKNYSLAGYNLIYNAWVQKKSPINVGWTITQEELSNLTEKGNDKYSFLIDYDPRADWRIAIIEIEKIHVYTYGNLKEKAVYWSPMMLELSDVLYLDIEEDDIDINDKNEIINTINAINEDRKKSVEFLYLIGSSWNWGKNGMTNAAFIQKDAREYFKQYF